MEFGKPFLKEEEKLFPQAIDNEGIFLKEWFEMKNPGI